MNRIGTLESLFNRLGDLRTTSRTGQVMVLVKASACATDDSQARALGQNLDLVLMQMAKSANAECFRLHGLDYGLLLDESIDTARAFIPNARVALFRVMTKIGAGQSSDEGGGLLFQHFNLEKEFSAAAKVIVGYIKIANDAKKSRTEAQGSRALMEDDLKAVIAAYRKVGAARFLKTFARGQQICVTPERGPIKPKMTEYFISIDLLRKPFFEGVDLRANGDRFIELTKILDSIMLNSFETLSKAVSGQQLSINLNVQSVFSKAFDNFVAKTPKEVMRNVVIEFTQADAVLNYDGYAVAREHLRSKGARIAIDQISPSAIGLVNIGFLDAEIAKLHWHADGEDDLYEKQSIVERFRKTGIQPVLSRVDEERARDVGADLGIEMYQGFLIDSMLKSAAA